MKNALVVIFKNFEEIEAVCPIDILRRGGVNVKVAAMGNSLEVSGRSSIRMKADALFCDVQNQDFDAVIISGGAGVFDIANDENLLNFIKRHFEGKKITSAICAAPIVLLNAKILEDKRATSHPSVQDKLPNVDKLNDVVRDGNVITSQGAGTALEFALELSRTLVGEVKTNEISKAICLKKEND